MRPAADAGQMQVLEAIIVAVFVFIAMAIVSVHRIPTNPGTFQESALANLGVDVLRVRAAKTPGADDKCNETPCPFANDLERMFSLALAYRGPTDAAEAVDTAEFESFLVQALPSGARYVVSYSNGYTLTQLFPTSLKPPVASTATVVARTVVTPNWTVHSSLRLDSPWLRVGEKTGFAASTAGITAIRDPLNRTQSEAGVAYTVLLASSVPKEVVFGTYEACAPVFACPGANLVPHNISLVQFGMQVLPADLQPHPGLKELDKWVNLAKFQDDNAANNVLNSGERIYIDKPGAGLGVVSTGDLRLTDVATCRGTATCYAGSFVRAGDADQVTGAAIEAFPASHTVHTRDYDGGGYGEGDHVYLNTAADGTVNANDRRLSRVGLLRAGTNVAAAGHADLNIGLAPALTDPRIIYDDQDGDNVLDDGEAVFLGLDDTGVLKVNDIHLSTHGSASVRYHYDLKAVVWYGV